MKRFNNKKIGYTQNATAVEDCGLKQSEKLNEDISVSQ